jgi:hypothetical protein
MQHAAHSYQKRARLGYAFLRVNFSNNLMRFAFIGAAFGWRLRPVISGGLSGQWVLLEKQAYTPNSVEVGIPHPETDYIAADQSFYVLAKTKLLGPGESDSVTLTAPREPGSYDYVCTFPKHYASGMKGVMTVVP